MMKNEKLKSITTAELFTEPKKKGVKPILTTKDLPDEAIHKATVEKELKPIITTPHSEKEKDEKE